MDNNQKNNIDLYTYASYALTGVAAHIVGYSVELISNYGLKTYLPNNNYKWAYVVVGKVLHEGVENIISSGSMINLLNLKTLKDSLLNAFTPVYEESGKFMFAASFSYLAENLLNRHLGHSHDQGHDHCHSHDHGHDHTPFGIGMSAIASVLGASCGVMIYEMIPSTNLTVNDIFASMIGLEQDESLDDFSM